jgi:2,4-dienoyl-CoA reductase (NADPH2)
VSYVDVVGGKREAGRRVAIIGAGGIGFDVAELLSHPSGRPDLPTIGAGTDADPALPEFLAEWGVDTAYRARGGVAEAKRPEPIREICLLQRKSAKVGDGLAKTTGWIKRTMLKNRGVKMLAGVEYEKIDDAGVHVRVGGQPQVLAVDTVVVCAGQEPRRELVPALEKAGCAPVLIGGADVATELDAKRAIEQGTRVALAL